MGSGQKIGVLTFHKCINYGSYWQARCLVEGLRARGHDAELLDHDCREIAIAELRCAFQPTHPERTGRADLRHYGSKARIFFEAFAELPRSAPFSLHQPEAVTGYDAIVVGSDEVWNFRHPWYGGKRIFFGSGLQPERLISYAASFGNHGAEDGIHPDWAVKLGRFHALSVRDHNSHRLVRDGTGRDPEIVLDPCLLHPAPALPQSTRGDFALIYGHGFPEWLVRAVRAWSGKTGTRLLSVGYRNEWADDHRIDASPAQFAELMAGSRAVVTNFFHGCVFALLNGKPFATAPSDYRSTKVRDLAALLGAEHRIISDVTPQAIVDDLLSMPVLPEVAGRIHDYRGRSEAFLDAALS